MNYEEINEKHYFNKNNNNKEKKYRRRKRYKKYIKKSIENINIFKFVFKGNIIVIELIFFIYFSLLSSKKYNSKNNEKLKIALCTMGRNENLYINEFVNYYLSLGVDKLFLYDDNVEEKDKFINVLPQRDSVVIEYNKNYNLDTQIKAFTHCYKNHKDDFDWFIMIDMDEYLIIKNNVSLRGYLSDNVFDKCDFIKLHWVFPSDNELLHYDNRSLFERFNTGFTTIHHIKSIIRGHIDKLEYWVHSPYISPERNITCDNTGAIVNYTNLNFQSIMADNIDKAYFLHFYFKSTEEYINKYKRGYKNWFSVTNTNWIDTYFKYNKVTLEKIEMFEKTFNITLQNFRKRLNENK